jgi:hypothetical protein
MAEIATQGGGRFYHVRSAQQIAAYLAGELGEMAALAAREAQISLTVPAGATLVPLSAAYPARQADGRATVEVGDVPSDIELEIPIRLTLPAQPAGAKQSVEGTLTYRSPAGNRLSTPLNRVTVRFVEGVVFQQRDGVVAPVVEQVLRQMRAANVLGVSRARSLGRDEGARVANRERASLRAYASLLGEERAAEEEESLAADLAMMAASPGQAKQATAAAYAVQRSVKKFDKK